MGQQRRQFPPEFKADAVALVRSTGRPIAGIAHELGIGESNLSYWLKKHQENRADADPGRFEAETAEARGERGAAPAGRGAGGRARDPETSTAFWVKESRA
jgi:transposase